MRRTLSLSLMLALTGCMAQVSDLDDLEVNDEACEGTGPVARGTDFDLQFDGLTPHVNQTIFFAVTVGEERNIEAIMVLSGLDDPDLHLVVPKLLPEGQPELAFWADSAPVGTFNPIDEDETEIDHQWTRPICPNGVLRFEHTTPFQSVQDAVSTGAIFRFVLPPLLRESMALDKYRMWVTVTQLDDDDPEEQVQTRGFFRWSPLVEDPATGDVPEEDPRMREFFQIGGNALGEPRGAIDKRSLYRIEFVIDADDNNKRSKEDFVCVYDRERAPDEMMWSFTPDLCECDTPDGFDIEGLCRN